jgi:hypothetical protein
MGKSDIDTVEEERSEKIKNVLERPREIEII